MKLTFKEREWGGCPRIYMTVLKNILLAQRHLILLCQNYSISLKSWPRAPGLQGKEGERNSSRRQLPFWLVDLSISFLTRVFDLLLFLCLHKVGMCLLWPVFPFMAVRSASFVLSRCGKGAAHSRSPFCSALSGSCTQWLLCLGVCLHWEVQVFQVVLPSLNSELQGLGAPQMLCFLKFG